MVTFLPRSPDQTITVTVVRQPVYRHNRTDPRSEGGYALGMERVRTRQLLHTPTVVAAHTASHDPRGDQSHHPHESHPRALRLLAKPGRTTPWRPSTGHSTVMPIPGTEEIAQDAMFLRLCSLAAHTEGVAIIFQHLMPISRAVLNLVSPRRRQSWIRQHTHHDDPVEHSLEKHVYLNCRERSDTSQRLCAVTAQARPK